MLGFPGAASIDGWAHVYSGKVRDLYVPTDQTWHSGPESLLVVASDRISIRDRVVPTPIPGKGELLTGLTVQWFDQLAPVIPNHLISTDVPEAVAGRAMIVRKLEMYPLECMVAGYLTDSMAAEYAKEGAVNGVKLPAGLSVGDQLPQPIFLPAFKGTRGLNDVDVTFDAVVDLVGSDIARELRARSIEIYKIGHRLSERAGLVLAACKLEFGRPVDSGDETVVLADEVLTPDSSTFWLAGEHGAGRAPVAMGKQFVRQWIESSGWNRERGAPPPALPGEIVDATVERYRTVCEMLSGIV